MKLWRIAFTLAVLGGCVIGLGYAAERLLLRRTGHSWLIAGWSGLGPTIHDPLLGWTSAPSSHWPDLYGPGADCTYNARGFRGAREYADAVPPGRLRILVLGDSFADGLGVDDADTFAAWIERLWPQAEAPNLAKISYGAGQAILRYEKDGEGMEADYVLLALIGDDFRRAKQDRFNGYWPKPRFEVGPGGEAVLTGTPVPNFSTPIRGPVELFRRSALSLIPRQYLAEWKDDVDDEALAFALLGRFEATATARSQTAVLAYLPTLDEAASGDLRPEYSFMRRFAEARGIPFLPVAEAHADVGGRDLPTLYLEGNGHYSSAGNRLVAETAGKLLGL